LAGRSPVRVAVESAGADPSMSSHEPLGRLASKAVPRDAERDRRQSEPPWWAVAPIVYPKRLHANVGVRFEAAAAAEYSPSSTGFRRIPPAA